ncbi:MAG: hypothetical protein U1E76_15015 [Planctomycetota bacterium]
MLLARAARDAQGESGELLLSLMIEARAALRVTLWHAATGLSLHDATAISAEVDGMRHELRCERGEGFFAALLPGHAIVTAGRDRVAVELRAGELAEVELAPDR